MGKTRKSRIYWRGGRAWGDFRDFRAEGGKREPLVAEGEKLATRDQAIAERLATDRLKELLERRRYRIVLGIATSTPLSIYADHHLRSKEAGGFTGRYLADTERHLATAILFLGGGRELMSIRVEDIQRYVAYLMQKASRRGGELRPGTVRHHLNALSNLYRRAQSEGLVPTGFNPVASLLDKPTGDHGEAEWLEVHEAALLLGAARDYRPKDKRTPAVDIHAALATFLLTGGRFREVVGLRAEHVSFDRQVVSFARTPTRRLKSRSSSRTVPLWPQLEEILRPYVFDRAAPLGTLLFSSRRPSTRQRTGERMVTDLREPIDRVAERAGWKAGEIRPHMLRHTYCAARLQTLDAGKPVAVYTVAREMGHGSTGPVERIYAHLGRVRHRSEVVEYREAVSQVVTNRVAQDRNRTVAG